MANKVPGTPSFNRGNGPQPFPRQAYEKNVVNRPKPIPRELDRNIKKIEKAIDNFNKNR
jgi:hypothetical protein